jgi:hypothetical protein
MNGRASVEQPSSLSFDSTQTVRALTPRELQDPNQQKWFAIQLVVSDRPVNLEAMPRLDVFANYRLYAVQGRLGTKPCHALRLGFFTEHASALKMSEDMKALFRFSSVVQVSAAEQARFEGVPQMPPLKAVPMLAEVVDLNAARQINAGAPASSTSGKAAPQMKKPAPAGRGRGKYKSLSEQLLDEARQIERDRIARNSGKSAAAQSRSWLSRLLGRSK